MPQFYISITVSVDAKDFEEAYEHADEIVGRIDAHDPVAFDANHWNVEQEEF